uniref:Uncharacterized protein n=1 Tax=Rhizophora mucronata TaxID=61149 RepID=A0A2P2Q703_RHIMU
MPALEPILPHFKASKVAQPWLTSGNFIPNSSDLASPPTTMPWADSLSSVPSPGTAICFMPSSFSIQFLTQILSFTTPS